MKKNFLLILIIVWFSACTATRPVTAQLSPKQKLVASIDSMFNDPAFAHAHWGAKITSLKSGEVWYEHNAQRMFNPASNQKVLSGAVALTKLGADFRYETTLATNGSVVNGVLNGDLVVIGTGDPSLYIDFIENPREVLLKWANVLKQQGIRSITGNIIGDDNAWEDEFFGAGWAFDDFEYAYSTEINALQFNGGYVNLKITPPASLSGKAKVEMKFPTQYVAIENNLQTISSGQNDTQIRRSYPLNTIKISGNIVQGGNVINQTMSVSNQTLFFVTVLKEALQEVGISVQGSPKDCDDLPNWQTNAAWTTLHVHQSPLFSEILAVMEKDSQNLFAETFVRTIGAKVKGFGSFQNGRTVLQETLQEWGIPSDRYQFYDGSGLSRQDYVSPNVLSSILIHMRQSPQWQVWYDSLPIAGKDGTLKNRMKNTKAQNNVRAKTGTISNVRGLSGYVTTASGEELVFSFLVNGHLLTGRDTERITDTVLVKIAAFK